MTAVAARQVLRSYYGRLQLVVNVFNRVLLVASYYWVYCISYLYWHYIIIVGIIE